ARRFPRSTRRDRSPILRQVGAVGRPRCSSRCGSFWYVDSRHSFISSALGETCFLWRPNRNETSTSASSETYPRRQADPLPTFPLCRGTYSDESHAASILGAGSITPSNSYRSNVAALLLNRIRRARSAS